VSLVRRGRVWYVRLRWRDVPRMTLSTGTTNKVLGGAMHRTLQLLYQQGRLDLLGLLKRRPGEPARLTLRQLHHAATLGPLALEELMAGAASPQLGPLVDEWRAWLASPAGVSPRTKRRYAPKTVRRYGVSWSGFFEVLQRGRQAPLSALTSGFIAEYKTARVRAQGGPGRLARPERPLTVATINRDLVALGAFLTWTQSVKGLTVARPKLGREKEPQGRERWLSAQELADLERACLEAWPEWWPLFDTLRWTGMRYGEAAGLLGGDVLLAARRITVHEGARRIKTASSVRDVPVPEPLAPVLATHLARVAPGPADPVFPAPLGTYDRAADVFRRACIRAGLHDGRKPPRPTVTLHDLRHTFGVHAAQAGVPIARLQRLLGHQTAVMTMRYMKHAPEAYFAEDAARIAESMAGTSAETAARAHLARGALRRA